jgi:hypothetical protein
MNKYKPLKLDVLTVPAQGTAFVTGEKGTRKKRGDKGAVSKEYLKSSEWNELSPEARAKIIEARKKFKASDDDDKSVLLMKSLSKTIKGLEKSNQKLKKSVSALQSLPISDKCDTLDDCLDLF